MQTIRLKFLWPVRTLAIRFFDHIGYSFYIMKKNTNDCNNKKERTKYKQMKNF